MNTLTRAEIEKSEKGILTDFHGSKNLLVTFGGIQQGIGIPVFEFFNSVKDIDCDKIFIRDFNQTWYQKGVDKDIDTLDKLVNYLQETIAKHDYKRICFMGNSMGGYAAILFGTLLNIDKVIAFAPQTFIGKWDRLFNNDRRWRKQMSRIYAFKGKRPEYFDLQKFLASRTSAKTPIELYFSPKHRLDNKHALRLKNHERTTLFPINEGGHSVVKVVRDDGTLKRIIQEIFE